MYYVFLLSTSFNRVIYTLRHFSSGLPFLLRQLALIYFKSAKQVILKQNIKLAEMKINSLPRKRCH